jgi:hypothetical protein
MAGTIKTLLHAPGGNRSRFLPACLLGAMVSQAFPVRVALAEDDASATETAAARGLAIDGLKLADGGHCNEAIDKLTRAEKLHHAPIVLSRLGECLITQGKLVDGTEMLRKVLREPLPASPSPALQKARERAQTTLDATKSKIGNLAITIQGPSEGNTSVTVDGQLVPAILLDGDRPTDPGEHVVEATAPGYLKASTKTRVGPGEKQSVTLKLEPDPAAAAIAVSAATPVPVATQPRAPSPPPAVPDAAPSIKVSPPDRTAAYISLAIGGVALAAGGGFGALALKNKNDLTKHCTGTVCEPSSQSTLDSANSAATISTVLVGVGAAGLALGTILFVTGGPSTTGSTRSSTLALTRPRAFIGLGQAGFAADF